MIISLEGNIGAGKSTMLDYLDRTHGGCIVVKEDLDAYTNLNGSLNLLEKFYSNPTKYAFAFQTVSLMSKVRQIEAIMKYDKLATIVMERSITSDRYMFTELLHENGSIDDTEYQIYLYHYDRYRKYKPHMMLHLDIDVPTCYERIRLRNRQGEQGITVDYLTDLDTKMKTMMKNNGVYKVITQASELYDFIDEHTAGH